MNRKIMRTLFYSIFLPIKIFSALLSIVMFPIFLAFKMGEQWVELIDVWHDKVNDDRED
jgi:hypothetical protein